MPPALPTLPPTLRPNPAPRSAPLLQAFLIVDDKEGGSGKVDFVGNRTECALLMMLRNWGQDYKDLRILHHEATVGACVAGCCACWGWFVGAVGASATIPP